MRFSPVSPLYFFLQFPLALLRRNTQTYTQQSTPTHTHTHTHTHTNKHTHTHTHTQSLYISRSLFHSQHTHTHTHTKRAYMHTPAQTPPYTHTLSFSSLSLFLSFSLFRALSPSHSVRSDYIVKKRTERLDRQKKKKEGKAAEKNAVKAENKVTAAHTHTRFLFPQRTNIDKHTFIHTGHTTRTTNTPQAPSTRTYIHTYIHTYIYTYIHTYIHTHTHTHTHTSTHTHTNTPTHSYNTHCVSVLILSEGEARESERSDCEIHWFGR